MKFRSALSIVLLASGCLSSSFDFGSGKKGMNVVSGEEDVAALAAIAAEAQSRGTNSAAIVAMILAEIHARTTNVAAAVAAEAQARGTNSAALVSMIASETQARSTNVALAVSAEAQARGTNVATALAFAYSPSNPPPQTGIGGPYVRTFNGFSNDVTGATVEQGAKADTALQPSSTNGWEVGSHAGLLTTESDPLAVHKSGINEVERNWSVYSIFHDYPSEGLNIIDFEINNKVLWMFDADSEKSLQFSTDYLAFGAHNSQFTHSWDFASGITNNRTLHPFAVEYLPDYSISLVVSTGTAASTQTVSLVGGNLNVSLPTTLPSGSVIPLNQVTTNATTLVNVVPATNLYALNLTSKTMVSNVLNLANPGGTNYLAFTLACNIADWGATGVTWAANIMWENGQPPEILVTGRWDLAFSSISGNRLLGRVAWPLCCPWEQAFITSSAGAYNGYAMYGSAGLLCPSSTSTNYFGFASDLPQRALYKCHVNAGSTNTCYGVARRLTAIAPTSVETYLTNNLGADAWFKFTVAPPPDGNNCHYLAIWATTGGGYTTQMFSFWKRPLNANEIAFVQSGGRIW